jgi:hypothetical protein
VTSNYFQRVRWIHANAEDPVALWAHVVDGWELRKVDEFADGGLAWADGEQGRAPGCRPGPDPVLVQLLPARRQIWFFLVARALAESQVHWWTSAPTAVEIPLTSTHLPLCTATSW